MKFDPQAGSVLHIEMARSNSRKKWKPGVYSFPDISGQISNLNCGQLANVYSFSTGSSAYVVIDQRTKAADTHETSSADGKFLNGLH